MQQTKLESLIESIIRTLTGIMVSVMVWIFIVTPLWGFETTMADNFTITSIFAFFSMMWGYVVRRFFNSQLHKKVHAFVKWLVKANPKHGMSIVDPTTKE